jgi:phosphoribosylaminoimidazole carboxylase (NCAIR synthetase)
MSNLTLSISDELREKLDEFREINWSAVAREAFVHKVADLEFLREFRSKSDLTTNDVERLSKEVNDRLSKRYLAK